MLIPVSALVLSLVVSGKSYQRVLLVDMGGPVSVPYKVPYSASGCIALGGAYEVLKVWTFIGSDRGDMIEADIQLSSSKTISTKGLSTGRFLANTTPGSLKWCPGLETSCAFKCRRVSLRARLPASITKSGLKRDLCSKLRSRCPTPLSQPANRSRISHLSLERRAGTAPAK